MKVKKVFEDLMSFLEVNKDQTVNKLMSQIMLMCEARPGGGGKAGQNVVLTAEGTPEAIFCTYHQKWERILEVDFGIKESSSTGLNGMCKEGQAAYAKQNAFYRKSQAGLLDRLTLPQNDENHLTLEGLSAAKKDLEEARNTIIPRKDGLGVDNREDLLN